MNGLFGFIVSVAASTLPRQVRDRYREEWLADLDGAGAGGVRPSGVAFGALLFSLTLGRTAPEITGVPLGVTLRRRVRWSVAFLGSAGVLWFGMYFLGASRTPLAPASAVLAAGTVVLALAGIAQLWRAALGASALAVITAALITGAVGCIVAGTLMPRPDAFLLAAFGLIVAGGVCGAIVASSAPPVPARPRLPERRPVGATIIATTIGLAALLALGAVELLVWGPLSQTEGLALGEIYAGLSAWDRAYGLFSIILWLAFWSVAVMAFAIATAVAGRRRSLSRRTAWAIALGLAAAIVFFQFWAGVSLGMSIADTLPPYRGSISGFGYLYAIAGQLSLVGAILLGIAPRRIVGPAGIEPTTSTV